MVDRSVITLPYIFSSLILASQLQQHFQVHLTQLIRVCNILTTHIVFSMQHKHIPNIDKKKKQPNAVLLFY